MKGDFSRQTFDARKHYSGVLMQQGRVQTDADWNEQEAIQRRRTQIESRDVIGRCGAPEDDAGFAVTISGSKLTIGAGRYYVEGLLCENETDALAFESQPDSPQAPSWIDVLSEAKATLGLVYLDAWERHITPLDDPLLREVALGGPDTATRIRTVWQVRVLPVTAADPNQLKDLQKKRAAGQKKLDELRAAGAKPEEIAKLDAELAKIDAAIADISGGPSCDSSYKEWDDLIADPDRRLNARTQPPPSPTGPCVVPPTAGYRRLENQLYRVEVHNPGAAGAATFKWSRDNATVVTAIEKISGKDVTVTSLGPDEVLGFASGQWVEIADDRNELHGKPGQLFQIDTVNSSLRRITLKSAPTPLAGGADGVDKGLHPKLRRWDQSGDTATTNGVAVTGAWLALEDGVEVQFSNATFRTGDYWLIPARTAIGDVEWPPFQIPNTSPLPQPRRGIRHHFCRLALLSLDEPKKAWSVAEDCRPIFPPLTEPCCEKRSLHVVGTNWQNDEAFTPATMAKDGLRIRLDGAPDPASLTNDTVQVALEIPFSQGQDSPPSPTNVQRVYIRGVVGRDPADDRVIVWRTQSADTTGTSTGTGAGTGTGTQPTQPTPGTVGFPTVVTTLPTILTTQPTVVTTVPTVVTPVPTVVRPVPIGRGARKTTGRKVSGRATPSAEARDAAPKAVAERFTLVQFGGFRIRVTLKGHCIWNDAQRSPQRRRLFLDGQAFAQPGLREDKKTPRIDLVFPTGHHAAASDFESWFLFGGAAAVTPLQVTTVRFLNANNQNSSAGDVKPPVPADQKVTVKAGENIRIVELTFNRPVAAASSTAASIFVDRLAATGAGTFRIPGSVALTSPTVARVTLQGSIDNGNHMLTCLGTAVVGGPGPVGAADDQSALDGNYDSQAGGDFKLPFTAQ